MKTELKGNRIKYLRLLIVIIALFGFLFAAYKLYFIFHEYQVAKDEYNDLEDQVTDQSKDQEDDNVISIDFDKLLAMNEDTTGWIYFETLPISYPIMQGDDNDYYLHHTFDNIENTSASIFIDYQNNINFSDRNTFIYGHNMKNDTMFGRLNDYKDESFYNENQYFWILTPDKKIRYQIFSCYIVNATSNSYQLGYSGEDDFQAYLDMIKDNSLYDTGVDVSVNDKIVSLSTCTSNPDNRFLVHAVPVKEILE